MLIHVFGMQGSIPTGWRPVFNQSQAACLKILCRCMNHVRKWGSFFLSIGQDHFVSDFFPYINMHFKNCVSSSVNDLKRRQYIEQ